MKQIFTYEMLQYLSMLKDIVVIISDYGHWHFIKQTFKDVQAAAGKITEQKSS